MKKWTVPVLTLLLLFAFATTGYALTANTAEHFTYTTSDGKVTITGLASGYQNADTVVIPSRINGYSVTSIGGYSFRNCVKLTSIEIPSGVIGIGSSSFEGCGSLTS